MFLNAVCVTNCHWRDPLHWFSYLHNNPTWNIWSLYVEDGGERVANMIVLGISCESRRCEEENVRSVDWQTFLKLLEWRYIWEREFHKPRAGCWCLEILFLISYEILWIRDPASMTTIFIHIWLVFIVIYNSNVHNSTAVAELEFSRFIALFGPRHK